jgi:tetratricopeptide (TPR) repeat protein
VSQTLEEAFEYLANKAQQSKTLGVQERLWKLCHYLVPDHGPTNSNLGNVYLQAGLANQAIQYLENGADSSTTLGNLGAAYIQVGDMESAGPCLHKAVEKRPDYYHALSNLGHVYRALQKNDKALEYYIRAYEECPRAAFVINIANALTSMGELEKAIGWLKMGVEQYPEYTEFWNNLGNIYNKLGEYKKAIAAYDKRLEKVDCVSAAANKVLVNLYRPDNNPLQQREIAESTMKVLEKKNE